VLRGPQSAQFGRATFSGDVNYITRRPSNDFEGEVFARGGSSDEAQLSGWWSGPIVEDKLTFLVSGAYLQYGGQWQNQLLPGTGGPVSSLGVGGGGDPGAVYVQGPVDSSQTWNFKDPVTFADQNTGGDFSQLGEEKTLDFLGKLSWMPTESSEFNLKYSYTKGDDGHYANNIFDTLNCYLPVDANKNTAYYPTTPGAYCGPVSIDGTVNQKNLPDLRNGLIVKQQFLNQQNLPAERRFSQPAEPGLRRETHRVLGEWVQDIGECTSVFKASYIMVYFDSVYDLDNLPVRAFWGLFGFHNEFKTEEFKL
jgi:hypothetical protein